MQGVSEEDGRRGLAGAALEVDDREDCPTRRLFDHAQTVSEYVQT